MDIIHVQLDTIRRKKRRGYRVLLTYSTLVAHGFRGVSLYLQVFSISDMPPRAEVGHHPRFRYMSHSVPTFLSRVPSLEVVWRLYKRLPCFLDVFGLPRRSWVGHHNYIIASRDAFFFLPRSLHPATVPLNPDASKLSYVYGFIPFEVQVSRVSPWGCR